MNVKNLDDIVESGLCAGCGICESMVGRDVVEMGVTLDERLRPKTKKPLESAAFQEILKVSMKFIQYSGQSGVPLKTDSNFKDFFSSSTKSKTELLPCNIKHF